MCEKDMRVYGKFYLKNGIIIKEEIIFDKENSKERIDDFINNIEKQIDVAFEGNLDFTFTFGSTHFRGSEIAAISIIKTTR